jgi:hypothetical protein
MIEPLLALDSMAGSIGLGMGLQIQRDEGVCLMDACGVRTRVYRRAGHGRLCRQIEDEGLLLRIDRT